MHFKISLFLELLLLPFLAIIVRVVLIPDPCEGHFLCSFDFNVNRVAHQLLEDFQVNFPVHSIARLIVGVLQLDRDTPFREVTTRVLKETTVHEIIFLIQKQILSVR